MMSQTKPYRQHGKGGKLKPDRVSRTVTPRALYKAGNEIDLYELPSFLILLRFIITLAAIGRYSLPRVVMLMLQPEKERLWAQSAHCLNSFYCTRRTEIDRLS
jgi:hypothetical protein